MIMTEDRKIDLPRDNLFRGVLPFEFSRSDSSGDGHLVGHFAVFDQWTRISSFWEGDFMERIAPGAFKKTIKERADQIRVLFQHGRDPQIGDKPLGTIESLAEDDQGAAYDVKMFDTSYNRDLLPGLEARQYGASFRMQVMIDELDQEPDPSEENPQGIPERTIKEIKLYEFGPVTFPAYENATAGIRSLTDEMVEWAIKRNPERAAELLGLDLRSVINRSDTTTPVVTPISTGTSEADHETTPEADHEVTSNGAGPKITSHGSRRSDLPRLVVKPNPNKERE
jgi:HK97 family phage prohead protease